MNNYKPKIYDSELPRDCLTYSKYYETKSMCVCACVTYETNLSIKRQNRSTSGFNSLTGLPSVYRES